MEDDGYGEWECLEEPGTTVQEGAGPQVVHIPWQPFFQPVEDDGEGVSDWEGESVQLWDPVSKV